MSWKNGLLPFLKATKAEDPVVFVSESIVIIKDLYPKSKHHFLVMPRQRKELADLNGDDIEMIEGLMAAAQDQVQSLLSLILDILDSGQAQGNGIQAGIPPNTVHAAVTFTRNFHGFH